MSEPVLPIVPIAAGASNAVHYARQQGSGRDEADRAHSEKTKGDTPPSSSPFAVIEAKQKITLNIAYANTNHLKVN